MKRTTPTGPGAPGETQGPVSQSGAPHCPALPPQRLGGEERELELYQRVFGYLHDFTGPSQQPGVSALFSRLYR